MGSLCPNGWGGWLREDAGVSWEILLVDEQFGEAELRGEAFPSRSLETRFKAWARSAGAIAPTFDTATPRPL